jgi:hypothetical protein
LTRQVLPQQFDQDRQIMFLFDVMPKFFMNGDWQASVSLAHPIAGSVYTSGVMDLQRQVKLAFPIEILTSPSYQFNTKTNTIAFPRKAT